MADTFWLGSEAKKLYLQSGQFSSTLKTSLAVGSVDAGPWGISWDGTNTPWCGSTDDKLYLQSGQFSTTMKTSFSVFGIDFSVTGISYDINGHTPWSGQNDDKLYLQSGQFSSIMKTSLYIGGIDTFVSGISCDKNGHTPWIGLADDKLYLQSGQFSSTMKTSLGINGIDGNPSGISYDGTNTPWTGYADDKLYLQSGQFSSTLKTSLAIGSIDTVPTGIEHGDVNARLGSGPVIEELAGTVDSVSATSADLTSDQSIAGIISSNSGIDGALSITTIVLFGGSNSVASIDASLTVTLRRLAGSIDSISVVTGKSRLIQELVGFLAGECGVAPGTEATLTADRRLRGLVSAQSDTKGIVYDKLGIQLQYYKTEGADDNYMLLDNASKKLAQTFPVLYRHSIYRVDLKLFRVGSPGLVTIEIRENDGSGDEYYPSGAVVASGTYDGDSLTTDSGGQWEYISLSSPGWLEVDIDYGKVYGIVISCAGADSNNKIGWRYDDTSAVFSGGRLCYYDGASWSQNSGDDFMFGEWGHRPNLVGNILSSWPNTDLTCSISIKDYDLEVPLAGGEYEFTLIGVTTYNNNAPISMPESDYDGNVVRTYRNDFYYRIHVYEINAGDAPIDIGLILDDIDQKFWIWNAYLDDSKTLDDVSIDGELTLLGISAPTVFESMQAEECTAQILKEGLPEYRAEISFDFGAEGVIVLVITGTRVTTLFWRPENSIRETLDWRTEVLRSKSGVEQRIKLRQIPRQFFRLRLVIETNKMNTWFDSMLHTWQKRAWGIPVWTEAVDHVDDITAGDFSIDVDTTHADFRNDSYAIIWKSELEYEVVLIETKTDTILTLSSAVQNTFTGSKLIMPLRIAYMVSKNVSQRYNSPASTIEALFAVHDNADISGHTPVMEYDGLEVLSVPSYMDAVHNEESDGQIIISDFETGTFRVRSDSEFNLLSQNHVFLNNTKENCWKFRQFLHWLDGRQKAILIPTFRADLNQIGIIGSGDAYFDVENLRLSSNLGSNTLRTYVGFYFPDETLIIRKIISIEEIDDTKERVTINASLGVDVDEGDCRICFVDKCRLTSDAIEIDWSRAHRNECRTNLTRVS